MANMHDPVYTPIHYVLNLFIYYYNIVHKNRKQKIKKEFILILNYMYTVTFANFFFYTLRTILQRPNVKMEKEKIT